MTDKNRAEPEEDSLEALRDRIRSRRQNKPLQDVGSVGDKPALLRAAVERIFQGAASGFLGDKDFRPDEAAVGLIRDAVRRGGDA